MMLAARQVSRGPTTRHNKRGARLKDPEATKRNIISIATKEFAEKGLSGARVDEIAERTRTSKRMLYYYYKNKEGIYIAVLEHAYHKMRDIDQIDTDGLAPDEALRRIVSVSFMHHVNNPNYVRLIMNENLHHGKYIRKSANISDSNSRIISILTEIIKSGQKIGIFREAIDPIDLHMTISALCFSYVSNKYTFGTLFRTDMDSAKAIEKRREDVVNTVLASVRRQERAPRSRVA